MEQAFTHHPSSYRDPSGFIFMKDGVLYRQVNRVFAADFDHFTGSGCYEKLVEAGLLIPHKQVNENLTGADDWHATLKPEPVEFITYPYEWSFDMLRDAALLTLQLLKESIPFGLILKDATPYNIQWHKGQLIFIDSLSFEKYREEEPWIAYRQFCEQFLGPLLLMHYHKMQMPQLNLAWPEGIPLEVTRSLLPGRSRFSLHTYLHIHLNARVSASRKPGANKHVKFSKQKLLNIVGSLETRIRSLKSPVRNSTWSAYYEEASGRENYLEEKQRIISEWTASLNDVKTAADLGANDGLFAKLLARQGKETLAADLDPYCITNLYRSIRETGEKKIQPLVTDLANPSPAIGVNNNERSAFTDRLRSDLVLALALIHHLAIG
ncbi:MAG: hypothetical protein ACO25B_11120, partial [Chitinophagaceae bacterium]